MDIKSSWRSSLVHRMEQRQTVLTTRLSILEKSKRLRATAELLKTESDELFSKSEDLSSSEDLAELIEAVRLLELSLEKIQGANLLAKQANELAESVPEDTWTQSLSEVFRTLELKIYKMLFA